MGGELRDLEPSRRQSQESPVTHPQDQETIQYYRGRRGLNPLWFLQPEVVGTYLPGTGTLGWGAWCGAGTPRSRIFIHHTWVRDQPVLICAPPTRLDGCGFFNSIVVRLPFNSISADSE